ncbi:hypothetical protein HDU96_006238 [Phlyctochytrium bullatum]|nr:hypothetical protein HDU96_006238 [Phlyctochytrium bullatum]
MSRKYLMKAPYQTFANSFRSNKVPRLMHAGLDHKTHLASVIAVQTQELLAAKTPDAYIKTLHTQLNGMVEALHDCIDALSEEQRMSETLRLKLVKAYARINADEDSRKRDFGRNKSARSTTPSRLQDAYLQLCPRPRTVDPNNTAVTLRSVFEQATHRRSRSAEPQPSPRWMETDIEAVLHELSASINAKVTKHQSSERASRPSYKPEAALLTQPLFKIAMAMAVPRTRRRTASVQPQEKSMKQAVETPELPIRAVTAPDPGPRYKHHEQIIVPAARNDPHDSLLASYGHIKGDSAPPPTPMPPMPEDMIKQDAKSVNFASSLEDRQDHPEVASWRLQRGSTASGRYKTMVPRIAPLAPFLGYSGEAKAFFSSNATIKKWDTSNAILARPRGDPGTESVLQPFKQPESRQKALSIRAARRMLSQSAK